MKRLALVALIIGCTSVRVPEQPLFEFHNNFWLNLHHYVRAVGRGMPAPGELTAEERAAWDDGVAFYRAHYINRDLAFDHDMVDIKTVLRAYEGRSNLDGAAIDPELRSTLERIAPIYRKYWWPAHRDANAAWIAAARPLIRAHGRAVSGPP